MRSSAIPEKAGVSVTRQNFLDHGSIKSPAGDFPKVSRRNLFTESKGFATALTKGTTYSGRVHAKFFLASSHSPQGGVNESLAKNYAPSGFGYGEIKIPANTHVLKFTSILPQKARIFFAAETRGRFS